MPEPNLPETEDQNLEGASGYTEAHKTAWNETIEDMWTVEERLKDDGWDTIETAAGHTGLSTPTEDSEPGKMIHVVPDSDGEAIQEAIEKGEFPTYDVYRKTLGENVFEVIVLLDPESEQAILISTQFDLKDAKPLIKHTHKTGSLQTVIKFLNQDLIAVLRHENPEKFFPDYDSYEET